MALDEQLTGQHEEHDGPKDPPPKHKIRFSDKKHTTGSFHSTPVSLQPKHLAATWA